jgi:Family of unknown function (DUF6510)
MDETQLRLDGNAAAGLWREVFVPELTAARGKCAACGAIGQLGGQPLYMAPLAPGAVLRCGTCQEVLLVAVRVGGRYRLALRGLTWLEVPDAAEAAEGA